MKQTTGHHANEGALKHLLGVFHFLIKGSPAMMPTHTRFLRRVSATGATGFSSIKQRKQEGGEISLAWLRRQNTASWGEGGGGYPQSTWGVPTPNRRRA